MEIEEVSVKISGRKDINKIYKEKGSKALEDVKSKTKYCDNKMIWNTFIIKGNYSILGLYEAHIDLFLTEIEELMSQNTQIFVVDTLKKTIKNDMLNNIDMISNGVFGAEIRNQGVSEKDYIDKIVKSYDFFNKISKKYPYWHIALNNFLNEATEFVKLFLNHIISDWKNVTQCFSSKNVIVKDLKLSMGDRHRGKFVIEIITSENNFFYKPRAAKLDSAFEQILKRISIESGILDMKVPKFLDYDNHSWFQKIEFNPLIENNRGKLSEKYYKRLGQLVAIIYILNGCDIHYENIISDGEYPVIIDIEALLTSRLRFKKKGGSRLLQNDSVNYIDDSVRNSLILPNMINLKNQYYDFSPFKIYNYNNPNTPEDLKKKFNHKINKSELQITSKYLIEGFTGVYQIISNNKEIYKKLFISLFDGLKLRFLNKPTDDYAKILTILRNPVCLFNFKYAFSVASKIINCMDSNVSDEELFELRELLKFNIPYFEIEANSSNLILSSNYVLKDYFIESPINGLIHKVNILSAKDLQRQVNIIKNSFFILTPEFKINELDDVKIDVPEDFKLSISQIDSCIDSYIQEIFANSDINPITSQDIWSGPELEGNWETEISYYHNEDYPNSYYTGNVGILRGLIGLKKPQKYKKYIEKLKQDIEIDIDNILDCEDTRINIGAYNGIAQYLRYYGDLFKYNELNKEFFISRVSLLISKIEKGIYADKKLDILDGVAGVALSIIRLHQFNIDKKLNEKLLLLLKICYKHLLNCMLEKNGKYYFPTEQDKDTFFTGFAHGTAGIIMTLNKCSKTLNIDNKEIIYKLLNTEREYYNREQEVWFRDNRTKDFSWGWCHGIPGILLSRIELLSDGYDDIYIKNEIIELYEISLNKSLGSNLTICHGDIGNLIILKYVQKRYSIIDERIDKYIEQIVPTLLTADKLKIRGTEAVGLVHGFMGIICFLDTLTSNDYMSLINILKITDD